MSDQDNFGFGKFVPGFDFLQNLAKGAAQNFPQLPNLANWVAPTLNVEELDKRITELRAVHFWLDQNGKALSATIQALEVQKMTLATLEGMNLNMGEVASALTAKATDTVFGGVKHAAESAAQAAEAMAQATTTSKPKAKPAKASSDQKGNGHADAASVVDPLQWWGALTQQFQEIATNAFKDVAQSTAAPRARKASHASAKGSTKSANSAARPAAKAAPRKRTRRSTL